MMITVINTYFYPLVMHHIKHYSIQSISSCVSFLQYIAYEISPDDDEEQLAAPSKEQLDEEKQLLLSFKPVMQKFLHDHIDLQVSALYALQVHCNTKSFPKGECSAEVQHRSLMLMILKKNLDSLGMEV